MNATSETPTQSAAVGPNKALNAARKAKHLSPRELGHLADVSHVTICRLELGLCRPRERTMRMIAAALDVSEEILWPPE